MKINYISILVVLLTNTAIAFAQNSSDKSNAGRNRNALAIARAITESKNTDLEKTHAIYKWIKTNKAHAWNSYEQSLKNSNEFGSKSIDSILLGRKGICEDYSALATEMLLLANIKSEVIGGYANYDDEDFLKDSSNLLHAWNSVIAPW